MNKLTEDLARLNCPFDISDLRRAAHEQIDDLYKKYDDGLYYRPEVKEKWKNIAGTQEKELISREKYDQIVRWLSKVGNEE